MRRAVAVSALAAFALLAPASAQGAKVTETAPGIAVPDSRDSGGVSTQGEGVQTFTLKGSKVRKKQVLDVNVILNAATSAGTTSSLENLRMRLIAPNGDEAQLPSMSQIDAFSWVDLRVDDQSLFFPCDPEENISSRCNYGPDGGTLTGPIHGALNPFLRGVNPKGTWRLIFADTSFAPPGRGPSAIGTTTLEVKTGKRFAKEGK